MTGSIPQDGIYRRPPLVSRHVREYEIHGVGAGLILRARLRDVAGNYQWDEIDLDAYFENENGRIVCRRAQEQAL
jgi:hypothetical protein